MALLLKGGRVVDPRSGSTRSPTSSSATARSSRSARTSRSPKGETVECAEKIVVPGSSTCTRTCASPAARTRRRSRAARARRRTAASRPSARCRTPIPSATRAPRSASSSSAPPSAGVVRVYPIGAITVGQQGRGARRDGRHARRGRGRVLRRRPRRAGRGHDAPASMDYAKQFDATIVAHCEDEALVGKGVVNEGVVSTRLGLPGWPAAAEEIMVARDIALAELTGCRLHLAHLSTAGSRRARARRRRRAGVARDLRGHAAPPLPRRGRDRRDATTRTSR